MFRDHFAMLTAGYLATEDKRPRTRLQVRMVEEETCAQLAKVKNPMI